MTTNQEQASHDQGLRKADLKPNPFDQFKHWFDAAWAANIDLAHAMTLATATLDGTPSARMVILRGLDERGFVFYTHSESRKAQDLAENPKASLVSFWRELDRQVRIEGTIELLSRAEAEAFFQSRPRANQLQLWLFNQRDVIANRQVLATRLAELEAQYQDRDIPAPPGWGGYRLIPHTFDFWEGRRGQLQDRFRYRLTGEDSWLIERIAP